MRAVRTAAFVLPMFLFAGVSQAAPVHHPGDRPALMGPETDVTRDPRYRWGEHEMAVNPKNPDNILYVTVGTGFTAECQAHSPDCQMVMTDFGVGRPFPQAKGIFANPNFNVVVAFVTFDRGKSWKRVQVPFTPADHPDLTGVGDPCVTAGPDGTFYISFDDNNWGSAQKALPDAGVGVIKSTDGGLTWSRPSLTGTPVDGPKITADLSTGILYAASSTMLGPHSTGDAASPPGRVLDRWLVSSRDGVHWTQPRGMGGMGAWMSAADGVLATAFTTTSRPSMFANANNALCGDAPAPCTVFETTADAGETWSRHVLPATPSSGWPLVAADPAAKGHFAVALLTPSGGAFQVFQTRDAGATWSGPVLVTDDAGKPHFHGHMAFSRQGVLGIMWRTRQLAPGQSLPAEAEPGPGPTTPYNVWATISRDGGASFSPPLKVSTANSPSPDPKPFGNSGDDYSSIALDGDHLYVGWADWRPAERSGFFRDIRLEAFGPPRASR